MKIELMPIEWDWSVAPFPGSVGGHALGLLTTDELNAGLADLAAHQQRLFAARDALAKAGRRLQEPPQ